MKTKQELLTEIQSGLAAGIITRSDIEAVIASKPSTESVAKKPEKTSAVDIMFYIAGIVLFSAMLSVIAQTWDDGGVITHLFLSAGFGIALWALASYLVFSSVKSEIRKGLTNALLLTGSLSILVGGYIGMNEIVGGFDKVNFVSGAITLAILGLVHVGFDRLVRKNFVLLMGILLLVASFPALLFGFLRDADTGADAWFAVLIVSAGLLAASTRVVARIVADRQNVRSFFDSFAAFVALAAMYVASFGEYGFMWSMGLVASIIGIFYLSIIAQNKHLLGSASFFLVVTVITVSFRYFSGFGATTSLIIAALGLLGSAAVASGINKKYFK